MLTLTYGHIKDPKFLTAMSKLARAPLKDPKAAYAVNKVIKDMSAKTPQVQEAFLGMLRGYALLDEKGEFVPTSNDGVTVPGTYQIPEDKQEAFGTASAAFNATPLETSARALKLDELVGADLSAVDLDMLTGVIEE